MSFVQLDTARREKAVKARAKALGFDLTASGGTWFLREPNGTQLPMGSDLERVARKLEAFAAVMAEDALPHAANDNFAAG